MNDGKDRGSQRLGQVDTSFYLIGVGASAGGLEAIRAFLGPVPDNCRHSFVFIQHLSPDYKSLMGDLLRRETRLPIEEVTDDLLVEPGHIYLVPPRVNIVIQGTHSGTGDEPTDSEPVERGKGGLRFSLIDQPPRPQLNLPIDLFFQSLAEAAGNRAVAIVLSGTGSDGSRGLRAVKDVDGIVMAQSPETAKFDGMPRAAAATEIVDLILPPDEMVGELLRYFEMRAHGLDGIENIFTGQEDSFREILNLAGHEGEIDFHRYKEPTLKRRIARRMAIRQCRTLDDYRSLIHSDHGEAALLCREFLVGVTHFFRDLPAWEALEREVLPEMVASHDEREPLKIWSAGCSTGEEAYSIAMLLDRYLKETDNTVEFRVFATDVNTAALRVARQGVYPVETLEDVPAHFTDTYFQYRRDGVVVSDDLRKKIIFSVHDVNDDPPFSGTDLVLCRNMLIYMAPSVQSQILASFSFSLKPDGCLFLGASESIERGVARFGPIDARWRIFKNIGGKARRFGVNGSEAFHQPRIEWQPTRHRSSSQSTTSRSSAELIKEVLDSMESCVLVIDNRLNLLQTFGDYRAFLSLPEESFSPRLPDLLPSGLTGALSLALRKAAEQGTADHPALPVEGRDGQMMVRLHCRMLTEAGNAGQFVVALRRESQAIRLAPAKSDENGDDPSSDQALYVAELESELATTRDHLETAIEDLGVSNEELQAANEELMSANEELQSTNEELQSTNEELHTVNVENQERITQLDRAYADIDNLLNTAEPATVFLDQDLRIRRFCNSVEAQFALDTQDLGRPLNHFSSKLESDDNRRILSDAELVLTTGETKDYEVRSIDGAWYLARIRPYSDRNGARAGVILKFVNITELKDLQIALGQERDRLEGLLESEAAGYWDWDLQTGTEFLSPRFKSMFGYEDHELENKPESWQRIIHQDDLPRVLDSFDAHVKSRGKIPFDNEVRYHHKDGGIVWVICRGKVIEWAPNGEPLRMLGCHVDITDLKNREQEMLDSQEIRRFAYISAHDLREPMSTIEGYLQILQEEMGEDFDPTCSRIMTSVVKASQRMKQQIEGILEYARLQDGALSFEPADMTALAKDAVTDLGRSITEAKATVTVGNLPQAMGAASLLARVVQNLLSNGIKFRDGKTAPVVTIEGRAAGDGMNSYCVTDNGVGIPAEHRERVFEVFTRLHPRSAYDGTGLGLALCQRIVSQHGGSISIAEGLDGGTAVTFTLKAVATSELPLPSKVA